MGANGPAEKDGAASYPRSQLVCREVRGELVALLREELSPLRAESVRQHLAACPECREEQLEMALAARSIEKLLRLPAPEGLAERAMRRIVEAAGWKGAPAEGELPRGQPVHPEGTGTVVLGPDERPLVARPRACAAEAAATSPRRRQEGPGEPPAGAPAEEERSREGAAFSGPGAEPHGDGAGGADDGTRETTVLPRPVGVLRRPIRSAFARAAVAAALLAVVLLFSSERVAEAFGLAQRRVLGPDISDAIERAVDAVLTSFRL
jgi:hypothetical protein